LCTEGCTRLRQIQVGEKIKRLLSKNLAVLTCYCNLRGSSASKVSVMRNAVQKVASRSIHQASFPWAVIIAATVGSPLTAQTTRPTTMPQRPEEVVAHAWDAIARADDLSLEPLIGPQGEEQRLIRGGLARVAAGIELFDRAMKQKFGPATTPRFASACVLPPLHVASNGSRPDFVMVLGDEPGPRTEIELIRQNGEWRLTFEGLRGLLRLRQVDLPLPNDEAPRRMTEMGEAIRAAAKNVSIDEYPTADAAQQAGREALVDASRGKNAQ
jgi:hypothetical protein